MKRRVYRSARLTLFFPLAVFVAVLYWCFSLSDSPVLILAGLALTATLVSFHRERIVQIWRQTLVLENDRLIYFDGNSHHEIRFVEIKLIRLNRWVGNFRVRQNEGHSLALMPQGDEKIEHWDLSDFSLVRVVLRLVCELAPPRRLACHRNSSNRVPKSSSRIIECYARFGHAFSDCSRPP